MVVVVVVELWIRLMPPSIKEEKRGHSLSKEDNKTGETQYLR